MGAGGCLACIAGYIDGVFFRLAGVAVTHVTGSAARLSADVATGTFTDAARVVSLIGAFCAGAVISGFVVGTQRLRIGRRYGIALIIESVLLGCSALLYDRSPLAASLFAASAAGLQNAMASTYAGLIVRTTHVTGIATDLGFLAGRWMRDRHVETWRLVLLLLLLAGFLIGAGVGTIAADRFGAVSIWGAAAAVFASGAGYFGWRVLKAHSTTTAADA